MNNDEKLVLVQELGNSIRTLKNLGWQKGSIHGLRRSEFMLLANLNSYGENSHEGVKVSLLSKRMDITPAAVTHLINSLEERGLVERLVEPKDRRLVLVKMTDKGTGFVEKVKAEHFRELNELVNFLGERDSEELIRILSSVSGFLKERWQNNGKKV